MDGAVSPTPCRLQTSLTQPSRPADWHDIPWLLSIYRLNGPNEWKKSPHGNFLNLLTKHIEVLGPIKNTGQIFLLLSCKILAEFFFFNTLFTRDILIHLLLYLNVTDCTHLNIHLHNKLLTTGISFCKNPCTCIHIIWQLYVKFFLLWENTHNVYTLNHS